MIAPGRELERVTRVTPFGFWLWDPVQQRPVSDGLKVAARDSTGAVLPVTAGPSGAFAIRGLPIALTFVRGDGDDAFWRQPPLLGRAWTIEVDDPWGRFLPFRFTADGAMRVGDLALNVCRIPPAPVGGGQAAAQPAASQAPMPILPLFSAPTRAVPPGMASVAATFQTTSAASASSSLLEVRVAGDLPALGMADGNGRVVVFLPYPSPARGAGNPPVMSRRPMGEEHWDDVRVQAFHDPGLDRRGLPDVCAVLDQFAADHEVSILNGPPPSAPLGPQTLNFGRSLVIRTAGKSVALLDTGAAPGP